VRSRYHQLVSLKGVSNVKRALRLPPFVAPMLLIATVCCAAEKGNVQRRDFTTLTRDAEGRVTVEKTEYDSDQDGKPDRSRIIRFTYAKGGGLSKKIIEDRDAQNSVSRRETFTFEYDDKGLLLKETMSRDGGDNTIDATMTQSFSYVKGRLDAKTTEHDDDADGKVDRRDQTSFVYSPDGKLIKEVVDTRLDSEKKVALRVENKFEYEDNRLAVKSTEADRDADGSIDRRQTVRYKEPLGSRPSVEETEIDADADGVVDQRQSVVHGFNYQVEQKSGWLWLMALGLLLVVIVFLVYLLSRSNAKKKAPPRT